MIPTHDGMSNERAYNGWGLMGVENSEKRVYIIGRSF